MTQVSHKQISKLVCSLPERWIGFSQPTQVKQNRVGMNNSASI